ncbi:MAG: DUF1540 domain-containing protein [Ruminococcaceae bacterium]|nr:DUF1540 domain-containing protein [Oscillospiraceae bacterium]
MNNITLNDVPKHIKGISCSVKECIHHDMENYCTANSISVGPSNASCCSETVCATFKKRCKDNCAPDCRG